MRPLRVAQKPVYHAVAGAAPATSIPSKDFRDEHHYTSAPHGATPDQLEAFLVNLANTGVVAKSAREAGITKYIVYALRRADPAFAKRWEEALEVLPSRVLDAVVEEAIEGEPIVSGEGVVVGRRRNTRLLERLAEKHGVIDTQRPAAAVQINNTQQAANDPKLVAAVKQNSERLHALLFGAKSAPAIIDAEVVDVMPVAALPSIRRRRRGHSMSINHDDPEVRKLFDIELTAQREGLRHGPVDAKVGVRITDDGSRNYLIGICAAAERNPTPEQAVVHDLAKRFTVTFVNGAPVLKAPDDLDPQTDPRLVERAALIAILRERARASSVSRS